MIEIGPYARYFKDDSTKLSYREVAAIPSTQFIKSGKETINLGFSTVPVWLKFSISNLTKQPLFIYFEAQEIDYIDIYVKGADTTYFRQTGALRPFGSRQFTLNSIVLPLGTHPSDIYISIRDINRLVFPVKIGAINPIICKIYHESLVNAFVLGVLVLAALLGLFMFMSLRDHIYLLYACHVLFTALTMLFFEGYLFEMVWREMPYLNNSINSGFTRLLTLLTSIAFSVAFLNLREILPGLTKAYVFLAIFAILTIPAYMFGFEKVEIWFNVTVTIIFLSYLVVGFWLYARGFKAARFYLLGWGIYITEILLLMLTSFDILSFEHFYTYYGYQIGSAFQAVFLTFALGDRIHSLRKEALAAQALSMQYLQEKQKLVSDQHNAIELELQKRGRDESPEFTQLVTLIQDLREKAAQITISTSDGVLLFHSNDIVRIEAMGSYANVYFTKGQKVLASRPLSSFEQQLKKQGNFFKIHKSHLINLDYLIKYRRGDGGVAVMSDGSELDVSRRAKPEFLNRLGLDRE